MKREDTVKTVGDYAGLLRRRWQYPATILPAGLLIALFIAYVLPVSYRGIRHHHAGGIVATEPSWCPLP